MFGQSSAVSPLVGTAVEVGAEVLVAGAVVDVDASICVDVEGDEADMVEAEEYTPIVRDEEGADLENDTAFVEEAEPVAVNCNGLEVEAVLCAIPDDKEAAVTLEFLEEL